MSYADVDGYFAKYDVRYNHGEKAGQPVPGPLFTLAFGRDPHARVALAAYADSVEREAPGLAHDLREALERHPLES